MYTGDLVQWFSWGFLGTAIILVTVDFVESLRQRKRYPPGPPQYPLVGNYPHLPVGWTGKNYAAVGKRYGPIVFFKVPGRKLVVLNKLEDALNLFERRGVLYSDRPHLHMAHELVGRKNTVLFSPYGERLKHYRRMMNSVGGARAAQSQWALQAAETRNLLNRLYHTPERFLDHMRLHAVATTVKMVYGHTVSSTDDDFVQLTQKMSYLTNMASKPGRWLVDSFNWLEYLPDWMPGAGFKRVAKQWRAELNAFTDAPMTMIQEHLKNGTAEPCFVVDQLEEQDGLPQALHEEYVKYAAAGLYFGGTDTTVAFLSCFILCMTLYPEVQRRIQQEMDMVVGPERLPAMEDEPSLQYLSCVIQEVHRIHPVNSLVPHSTLVDDEYDGYVIPAGAAILANIWAFSRDETLYPDPEAFRPERFLGKPGEAALDPRTFTFGLGRRRCPGVPLTDSFTFLAVARILAVFNIVKARDDEGRETTPEWKFDEDHFVSHPLPFKCNFELRADRSPALIQHAFGGDVLGRS